MTGRQPTKRSRPFGFPRTPFDPLTGTFLPLGDVRAFVDCTIVEVGHDFLLCTGADGRDVLIAKPWAFRKSEYDSETFEEVAYAAVDGEVDQRTATDADGSVVQEVSPHYFVGEKIVAAHKAKAESVEGSVVASELTGISAGTYTVDMEDMNTAGRRWDTPDAPARYEITAIGDNTLTVRLLADESGDFADPSPETTIWKPIPLQRQTYAGLTISGVTYTYVSAQERTASDGTAETQVIIPAYVVGDHVLAGRSKNGGAVDVPIERLIDLNNAGRAWSEEYVA